MVRYPPILRHSRALSTHPRKSVLLPLVQRLVEARECGADRSGGRPHRGAYPRDGPPGQPFRFRTIQICPNDLPAALWQAGRGKPNARLRHSWAGRKGHVRHHTTTRVHHATRRRGSEAACGVRAANHGGFLSPGLPEPSSFLVAAFREGLKEVSYIEGKNVIIEYRWARGQYDQLQALAVDLVRQNVAVIAATGGTISAQAAKAATGPWRHLFFRAVSADRRAVHTGHEVDGITAGGGPSPGRRNAGIVLPWTPVPWTYSHSVNTSESRVLRLRRSTKSKASRRFIIGRSGPPPTRPSALAECAQPVCDRIG
jgi:hypothetical protein